MSKNKGSSAVDINGVHGFTVETRSPPVTERMLENRIDAIELRIHKARLYVKNGKNITNHPDWVESYLLPVYYKWRAKQQKLLTRLEANNKDKKLTDRKINNDVFLLGRDSL